MEGTVFLNGEFISAKEARIPVMDYGFLFGLGVFATMRVYNGKVFRPISHLERLEKAARSLGIMVDFSKLKTAVSETILINKHTEARLRVTISAGEGSPSPDPRSCNQPNVLIVSIPYIPAPAEKYERGFSGMFSSLNRNSRSAISGMKTLNYLESLLARQEARVAGLDEAILLNEKDLVAESSTGNVFLVKKGIIKTPGEGGGLIPGTARKVVMEIAPGLGKQVEESDITIKELLEADEVFLTNSIIEIAPLVSLDGKIIGSGKPGPVTKSLMAAYKELVLLETGG